MMQPQIRAVIGGVGSRETPDRVLQEMEEIGAWCRKRGVYVRSGHADGADYAFEKGALEHTLVYLPFPGFNSQLPMLGHSIVIRGEEYPAFVAMTVLHHPAWNKCSHVARAMHTRNVPQVVGLSGEPKNAALVCWTNDGKDTGGTGQAIRIAEAVAVPVLNMYYSEFSTAPLVIDWLRRAFR